MKENYVTSDSNYVHSSQTCMWYQDTKKKKCGPGTVAAVLEAWYAGPKVQPTLSACDGSC